MEELYARELKVFENADASSNWFGPKWTVVQRCLKRYNARAEQQEKNPPKRGSQGRRKPRPITLST